VGDITGGDGAGIHNNDVHHRKSALGIIVKKLSISRLIVE
jgi:hypothetical protein